MGHTAVSAFKASSWQKGLESDKSRTSLRTWAILLVYGGAVA